MLHNPVQDLFAGQSAIGNGQAKRNQLRLRIRKCNAVQCQKYQHGMHTNPLVAINKWMVVD